MSATVVGQESLMHQAWNLLMDQSAASIAILGTGGIGKTTLMKQLYSKLISTNRFVTVIWITVSSNFEFRKIQDDISKSLGLFDSDWVGNNSQKNSQLIRTEISSMKSLLFLDDLWFPIDLTSLGVERCKFIYSTRFTELPELMGAYNVFKLEELSEEDAWELFRSKVGDDDILQNLTVVKIARELVSKCKGLPILISTLGAAMSCKNTPNEWRSAVRKIEQHRQRKTYDEVTSIFKFCFDSLPNSKIRSCLSYFSLFPEDFTILKDLIDFWICENIIGAFSTRGDSLNLGYEVMHTLIRAGFLEEDGNECVKLLDMIRDFAVDRVTMSNLEQVISNFGIYLAIIFRFLEGGPLSLSNMFRFAKASPLFTGWIPSIGNSIGSMLADIPTDLYTFLLKHNTFIMIKTIPSPSLYNLTVLDLSNSGIVVVPLSVSTLVSLQYLNLSHTWIDRLPIDLKTLTNLRCLNLEYDDQLRMISKELISSLSSLRILKMFRCGLSVEEEPSNMLSVRNMDINPFLSLEHLEVLSITITCVSAHHTFFNNSKLLGCTESLSLEVFWGSETINITTPLAIMKNLLTFEIHQVELLKESNLHYPDFRRTESFERLREIAFQNCSSLIELTWVTRVLNLTILRVNCCDKIQESQQ